MTPVLASLVGLLVVALAVVLRRHVHAVRRHDDVLARLTAETRAVEVQLAASSRTVEDLERRLGAARREAEVAERLRLQREWAELAGPGAALSVGWDASLACTVACELEIIREVVGTPATVETVAGDRPPEGPRLALAAEFLRAAALDADEMQVEVGDTVVVEASSGPPGRPGPTPHLESITALVRDTGADVSIQATDGGFTAILSFGA